MNIALYARVSTSDKGQDPKMQLDEMWNWCNRQGLNESHERGNDNNIKEYIEKESTSKTRPVLNDLLLECRKGKIQVLVVWKLDRFARSMKEFILNVNDLDSMGVRFASVTQGIDTDKDNPTGRLTMHILAAVAEFEKSLIQERVKAGMARAKAEGVELGRNRIILNVDPLIEEIKKGKSVGTVIREAGSITYKTQEGKIKKVSESYLYERIKKRRMELGV